MWWLLSALLFKPKTVFVALKTSAFAAVLLTPLPAWVKGLLALPVIAEVVCYVGGLLLVPPADRTRYAKTLLAAPFYLWVWMGSAIRCPATPSGPPWRRSLIEMDATWLAGTCPPVFSSTQARRSDAR